MQGSRPRKLASCNAIKRNSASGGPFGRPATPPFETRLRRRELLPAAAERGVQERVLELRELGVAGRREVGLAAEGKGERADVAVAP
jgi:hypothetical protein